MIIKSIRSIVMFLLLTFSMILGTQEKESEKLRSCNTIILDSLFSDYQTYFRYVKNLDQLTLDLNSYYCKITKEELKNILLNMYSKYKIDSTYSKSDKIKYGFIWRTLLRCWDARVENIVKNDMEYFKKKKDKMYFHRIWILTRHSENWFQYITDMYYNLDSIPPDYDFKSLACEVLIDKYGTSRNPVTLSKVESILYAIMLKDKNKSDFKKIDKYLSGNSEKYKKSKQRKMFFERLEEKIIQENKMHKSYSDFITSVKEYFNKNKRLTDYEPPFKFD
jgi:signal recognition particle GTPase